MPRSTIDRLVRQGTWTWAAGTFRAGPETWLGQAWAGVLLGGEEAVIGGEAALFLHGCVKNPPEIIDVWTPLATFRRHRHGPWRWRRGARPGRGGPPRTSVEDALIDAASKVSAGDLVVHLGSALTLSKTTPARMLRVMSARPRVAQRKLLLDLLQGDQQGVNSPLEQLYLKDVERPHGLPRGRRQVRRTATRSVTDVEYEEYATIIELDGQQHFTPQAQTRDRRRDNAHTLRLQRTLRYVWADVVGDPCGVALEVAALLRLNGWSGQRDICPRCQTI